MHNVDLGTIDKIKRFIHIVSRMDVDVCLISGQYVIDAKSILGIFSLDLMNPIEITFGSESGISDEKFVECLKMIEEFLV